MNISYGIVLVQANKSSSSIGPCTSGPRSRNIHQFLAGVVSEDAVATSQPTSPVKLETDHTLTHFIIREWSPLDDEIELVLPNGSANNPPSREGIDAYISSILYGLPAKRRLPAFVELCSE